MKTLCPNDFIEVKCYYVCIFINPFFLMCCFREMTAGIKVRNDISFVRAPEQALFSYFRRTKLSLPTSFQAGYFHSLDFENLSISAYYLDHI